MGGQTPSTNQSLGLDSILDISLSFSTLWSQNQKRELQNVLVTLLRKWSITGSQPIEMQVRDMLTVVHQERKVF